MLNFQDILNQPAKDIEKPKPLPVGTYLCIVNGPAEFPEKGIGQKETPAAILQLRPLQAREDVDQQALADAGGLAEKSIRHTLWLSKDAQWRTKEFRTHCGLDVENGATLGQLFSEIPNRRLYVQLKHRTSADGSQIFSEVASTAAA